MLHLPQYCIERGGRIGKHGGQPVHVGGLTAGLVGGRRAHAAIGQQGADAQREHGQVAVGVLHAVAQCAQQAGIARQQSAVAQTLDEGDQLGERIPSRLPVVALHVGQQLDDAGAQIHRLTNVHPGCGRRHSRSGSRCGGADTGLLLARAPRADSTSRCLLAGRLCVVGSAEQGGDLLAARLLGSRRAAAAARLCLRVRFGGAHHTRGNGGRLRARLVQLIVESVQL
mmetsp:Transcript_5865/g.17971  ORF Transcript_5865/g.17971 Transcript_5865/m.17971 type:complete len:227 (-) Transcript_5865:103-783(-)